MPLKFVRQSLQLTQAEWDALQALAVQFNTCPPAGENAGKPSWRSLIKAISDGKIILFKLQEKES